MPTPNVPRANPSQDDKDADDPSRQFSFFTSLEEHFGPYPEARFELYLAATKAQQAPPPDMSAPE